MTKKRENLPGMEGVQVVVQQSMEYLDGINTYSKDEGFQEAITELRASIRLLQIDCGLRQELIDSQYRIINNQRQEIDNKSQIIVNQGQIIEIMKKLQTEEER